MRRHSIFLWILATTMVAPATLRHREGCCGVAAIVVAESTKDAILFSPRKSYYTRGRRHSSSETLVQRNLGPGAGDSAATAVEYGSDTPRSTEVQSNYRSARLNGLRERSRPLSTVQALRGGAAGAWRVVDKEGRKERQAVRNVLLYYPNLIGRIAWTCVASDAVILFDVYDGRCYELLRPLQKIV